MLRLFPSFAKFASSPQMLQSRGFKRKPLWMPTAKSKVFRVPQRPEIPKEEDDELRRLFNNYRTMRKSLARYLTNRYNVSLQAKADTEALKQAFEEDLARCTKINDEWNEEVRRQRENRCAKELEGELEFARNRIKEVMLKKQEELKEAEEIVRREKVAAVHFITAEMLDEAIEKAINNPVDYNFALDLEGNMIMGRDSKPSIK